MYPTNSPFIFSSEIVERAYENRNRGDLLTALVQGGRSSSPRSLSRARFARVLVAFRKEKENNICVQATVIVNYYFSEKLTLQYLFPVRFLYI